MYGVQVLQSIRLSPYRLFRWAFTDMCTFIAAVTTCPEVVISYTTTTIKTYVLFTKVISLASGVHYPRHGKSCVMLLRAIFAIYDGNMIRDLLKAFPTVLCACHSEVVIIWGLDAFPWTALKHKIKSIAWLCATASLVEREIQFSQSAIRRRRTMFSIIDSDQISIKLCMNTNEANVFACRSDVWSGKQRRFVCKLRWTSNARDVAWAGETEWR